MEIIERSMGKEYSIEGGIVNLRSALPLDETEMTTTICHEIKLSGHPP